MGRIFSHNRDKRCSLIKTTSSGAAGWERKFGNSVDITGAGDYPTDAGFCVRPTADGGYILAGYVEGGAAGSSIYGHDAVLTKFNGTGTLLWTTRLGTSGTGNEDHGVYVSQTADAGYIVTGSTSSGASGTYDIFVVKRTSTGAAGWASRITTANWDEGYFGDETPDGGYILLGNSGAAGVASLIKLPSTGASVTWSRNYTVTGATATVGYNMIITSDEGFAITGYTTIGGNQDALLIKTNSAGTVQWSYRYGGSRTEEGNSIKQTSDGGFIIGGTVNSPSNGNQFYLIKTLSDGTTGMCEATVTTTTVNAGFTRAAPTMNTTASTEDVSNSASTRIARTTAFFKVMDCNYVLVPIELISFYGKYSDGKVILNWATATEMNNDYFTIEKDVGNGTDNWETSGTVFGAGNSSLTRHYSFADNRIETLSLNRETIFYRLKQTDYNGAFEYFGPIAVTLIPESGISIHANGSNGQLFVSFGDDLEGKSCSVKIYDLRGNVCFVENFIPAKSKKEMWIDFSNSGCGVYFASVISENGISQQKKFLKQ